MTSDGRTVWWAKDAAWRKSVLWWDDELVVVLGQEFGADGPAVLDWLTCEWARTGRTDASAEDVARGCFVDIVQARSILDYLARHPAKEVMPWLAVRRGRRMSAWLRALVMRRDDFTCRHCGWRPSTVDADYDGALAPRDGDRWLEVDHVIPLARGGAFDDSRNLQALCMLCNQAKGAK